MQIQRVDHESRVHIDIETDDIPAEVARLTKPRRHGGGPPRTLGSDAGANWPTLLRCKSAAPRFSEERLSLGLTQKPLTPLLARVESLG